jgi:hypothetical protein
VFARCCSARVCAPQDLRRVMFVNSSSYAGLVSLDAGLARITAMTTIQSRVPRSWLIVTFPWQNRDITNLAEPTRVAFERKADPLVVEKLENGHEPREALGTAALAPKCLNGGGEILHQEDTSESELMVRTFERLPVQSSTNRDIAGLAVGRASAAAF